MGRLEFLIPPILFAKVRIYFIRVFQNKREGSSIYPGQRPDRWVCIENRLKNHLVDTAAALFANLHGWNRGQRFWGQEVRRQGRFALYTEALFW